MDFLPIFASKEEANRAYIACGKVALNWGPVELMIESFLIKLRNIHQATDIDLMPLGFGRKVKQTKVLMKLDPAHAGLLDLLRPLLGKAKELHAIRTDVVHGICQGTDINGVLMFGKSEHKRGVAYTQTRYTLEQIEQAAEAMRQVQSEMEVIFGSLHTLS